METSVENIIQSITDKLKELDLNSVNITQANVVDMSNFRREYSLKNQKVIQVEGEVAKTKKDAVTNFNTWVNENVKSGITGAGYEFDCNIEVPKCLGDQFETIKDLTDLDGNKKELTFQEGVPMVIDFWATWCGPCQGPMRHNQEMLEKNPDWEGKVRIIGVGLDNTTEPLKKKSEPFTKVEMFHAPGGFQHYSPQEYGIKGIPFVACYDKNGKFVYKGHPVSANLDSMIPKLIDGSYKMEEKEKKNEEGKSNSENKESETKNTADLFKIVSQGNEDIMDVHQDKKPWIMIQDITNYEGGSKSQQVHLTMKKNDCESDDKTKDLVKKIKDEAEKLKITVRLVA